MTVEPVPAADPPVGTAQVRAAAADADTAADAAGVRIAAVHDSRGCARVAGLLNRIWGPSDHDIIDHAFLIALAHSGNLVALATRDGQDVGAAVGFSGPPDSPFHSHIVGVAPELAGAGVGSALKLHQRAWCLVRGIDRMTWTYDPLVARNAAFNIRRLGALPTAYHRNFYGPMTDAVNAGQDSDRMVIRWDLLTPPGTAGEREPVPLEVPQEVLAAVDGDDARGPGPFAHPDAGGGAALLAVPRDVEGLRRTHPAAALAWRAATGEAFATLLAGGWAVRGFTRSRHYLLRPERTP